MKPSISFLCMALFASVAGGSTVEISTDGWTGSGARKKWSFRELDATSPGSAARFKSDSRINSPIWPEAIVLSAAVLLACSTNAPTRFLQIKFLYDDEKPIRPVKFDAVTLANTPETQMIYANPTRNARGIELTMSAGDTGAWSVRKISLAYGGSLAGSRTNPPQGFAVSVR